MPRELPSEVTSFVGRERELRAVKGLLKRSRLATLVGTGGVGKTRIALRAATDLEAGFPDGVFLVELSGLQEGGLLPHTVAAAIGLPEQTARPAIDLLTDYLATRRALLVLDTCEHLIDACAMLAEVLLRTTSELRVLATSRQPLDAPGEHLLVVPPLTVPEEDDEVCDQYEAVRLFADRAAAVRPGFVLDGANAALAGVLCRRLDGIPLAIELAAVRLRALSLGDVVERVTDRFRLLDSGSRAALPRHQTLRTAIGWSHELCSPPERLLWARLSVFRGDFDLAAVDEICCDGEIQADAVLDHLIGLVDKSIVLRSQDEAGVRYRLLDTLREYGREWLVNLGQEQAVLTRHRDHYLRLARDFFAEWEGTDQVGWFLRIARELSNLRVALEYCQKTPGQEETGLDMASSLWGYWLARGRLNEGRRWLDQCLDGTREETSARARALWMTAFIRSMQGEHALAIPYFEEARALAERIGDTSTQAYATQYLAATYMLLIDPEPALRNFGEASALFHKLDDRVGLSINSYHRSPLATATGDIQGAAALADEALDLLGSSGERFHRSYGLLVKSFALMAGRRVDECGQVARDCLMMKHQFGDLVGTGFVLEVLAWVGAHQGGHRRSAWLIGAAEAIWEKVGHPRFGFALLDGFHEEAERLARDDLGEACYAEVHLHGFQRPTDEAVARAITTGVDDQQLYAWNELSDTERQIARLLVEGMGRRDIAERLLISRRTLDARIEDILGRLGLSSPAQIATVLADQPPATNST
ncbi:LuxR C-terminal-related transcriptional regulator [Spirillospora sp. NPDC047279]|uniref:ATP-binding protein n=1 Tax=Spirillospora sp. NPDC047279 TaxID=3155478 RepID=UPI0033D3007E